LSSRYLPGERSREWLKIKRRSQIRAVVCGYTVSAGRPGGLLLGGYRAGRLVYIGRAGSGLTVQELALLKENLPSAGRPFDHEPTLRDRFSGPPGQVVWTNPTLTIDVEFTEWTADGKLRDPVVVGFPGTSHETALLDSPEGGLSLGRGAPSTRSSHPG